MPDRRFGRPNEWGNPTGWAAPFLRHNEQTGGDGNVSGVTSMLSTGGGDWADQPTASTCRSGLCPLVTEFFRRPTPPVRIFWLRRKMPLVVFTHLGGKYLK